MILFLMWQKLATILLHQVSLLLKIAKEKTNHKIKINQTTEQVTGSIQMHELIKSMSEKQCKLLWTKTTVECD